MRAPSKSFAVACAATIAAATACAPTAEPAASAQDGPVAAIAREAAIAHDVPRDLVVAIAHVEGGLFLAREREVADDELVAVAGLLELRRGRLDTLALGASLSGASERDLQRHLEAGTDAGARVLDELARRHGVERASLGAWAPVVEDLSGHLSERDRLDYRARVFTTLRWGGSLPARGGERVELAPHPEVPLGLTMRPPPLATQGQAEFPGAEWFDTPCDGKCNTDRFGNDVSIVLVHDTEGGWDASVATLQNDPGKSCHYIIDADGSRVGQFIPESYTGWHAGNSYYNRRSVGIEHVGFAAKDEYQTALYAKSAELVKSIVSRHAVPLDRGHVVGHQEVPNGNAIAASSPPCPDSPGSCVKNDDYGGASNHRDPGVNWEWCQYMRMLGGACKCNDAYELWNCVHDLSMAVRCSGGTVELEDCPAGCVVEPIGTDDHCAPGGGGGGGGGATTGAGGAGGAATTSTTTTIGAGGAGGAAVTTATKSAAGGAPPTAAPASDEPTGEPSGCATGRRPGSATDAIVIALAAAGVAARRRRGARVG